MSSETLPEHLHKPHLRMIQPVPMVKDGKSLIALRDPAMLSKQTMVVAAPVLQVLMQFQGSRTIDEISEQFKGDPEQLTTLVRQLDRLGLLWGPTFEAIEQRLKEQIQTRGAIPAGAAASLGDDAEQCRNQLEEWLDEVDDPELSAPAAALVAPHLDYQRGWPNYAAAYRCLDQHQRPDRVLVLGTNHFGIGDGAVLCEYAFESPFGRSPADQPFIDSLIEKLGDSITADALDHLREHSIQLHLPWIQHRFGDVPVAAVLVPDPLEEMIEDDHSRRVNFETFIDTTREVLATLGGETLIIASSDLSHVGPQFGEPRPVDEQRRIDVQRHDRDMMGKYISGDMDDFLSAMRWSKNPTRWCSIGNMAAAAMLTQPETIELIDYHQAYDEQGTAMVSSAAMAMMSVQRSRT